MAPHSSTLAWRIPWTEEPGRLQSRGSLGVGHGWATFAFTFHSHALERVMATYSKVLAWRISGTEELDGLPSMGSHRVGHNWSDLAANSVYLEGNKIQCRITVRSGVWIYQNLSPATYTSSNSLDSVQAGQGMLSKLNYAEMPLLSSAVSTALLRFERDFFF